MTTNENDEKIGAEMKEMTTIFPFSMGANTRFSKFQKRVLILLQLSEFHMYLILLIFTGSRVKITLKITYIAKILWIGTRGSISFCNKAVANDVTYFLCYNQQKSFQSQPVSVRRLQTASGNNGNQWQPMVPLVKLPLVKLRTYPTFWLWCVYALHL